MTVSHYHVLVVAVGVLVTGTSGRSQTPVVPQATWERLTNPYAAGWDTAAVTRALRFADSIGSRSVLVVDNGRVVAEWGNVAEEIVVQSVRKSFMSALMGLAVSRGRVSLDATLGTLGVDDSVPPRLTPIERGATVRHLLESRSGIYHPSAASGWAMPSRGSDAPGARWTYNNWDFNALLAVYHGATGSDFFESLEREIARPLQMQDFTAADGFYQREALSEHPAYHFNMSARDMARFGLLYLRGGDWGGRQIIPRSWVLESTTERSAGDSTRYGPRGYAYLWWTEHAVRGFSARGGAGHLIVVVPDAQLVIVHRVTVGGGRVPRGRDIDRLIEMIVEAKHSRSARN